jgi:hypothetical protein
LVASTRERNHSQETPGNSEHNRELTIERKRNLMRISVKHKSYKDAKNLDKKENITKGTII